MFNVTIGISIGSSIGSSIGISVGISIGISIGISTGISMSISMSMSIGIYITAGLPLAEDVVVGLSLLPLLIDLLLTFDDDLLELSNPVNTRWNHFYNR